MNRNKREVLVALGYMALMALAMMTSYFIYGYKYDDIEINNVLVYFEAIMVLYALIIYGKFCRNKLFKTIKITPVLLIYIVMYCSLIVVYILEKGYLENLDILPKAIITTIFIAISEELVYRGVILSGFLNQNSLIKAVVFSALLFSLLHCVNVLAGLSFIPLVIQLINTFVNGLVLGCLVIEVHNLIPFIVSHFIWDTVMLSPSFLNDNIRMLLLILIVELVLSIILTCRIINQNKYVKGLV